jgi:hypothetical protein
MDNTLIRKNNSLNGFYFFNKMKFNLFIKMTKYSRAYSRELPYSTNCPEPHNTLLIEREDDTTVVTTQHLK